MSNMNISSLSHSIKPSNLTNPSGKPNPSTNAPVSPLTTTANNSLQQLNHDYNNRNHSPIHLSNKNSLQRGRSGSLTTIDPTKKKNQVVEETFRRRAFTGPDATKFNENAYDNQTAIKFALAEGARKAWLARKSTNDNLKNKSVKLTSMHIFLAADAAVKYLKLRKEAMEAANQKFPEPLWQNAIKQRDEIMNKAYIDYQEAGQKIKKKPSLEQRLIAVDKMVTYLEMQRIILSETNDEKKILENKTILDEAISYRSEIKKQLQPKAKR